MSYNLETTRVQESGLCAFRSVGKRVTDVGGAEHVVVKGTVQTEEDLLYIGLDYSSYGVR